ncbi:MAG: hypothetical protein OXP73_03870 [Chloroflexota bacterium]|nr:hypothetical protein [Chloroflexota bacterium]
MTLETADLLAIAGIVLGSTLAVVSGALAWLRADIADLSGSLRATGAKVDALIQVVLAGASARDSKANSPRTGRAGPAQLGRSPERIE